MVSLVTKMKFYDLILMPHFPLVLRPGEWLGYCGWVPGLGCGGHATSHGVIPTEVNSRHHKMTCQVGAPMNDTLIGCHVAE